MSFVMLLILGNMALGQILVNRALDPILQEARNEETRERALQTLSEIAIDDAETHDRRIQAVAALGEFDAVEMQGYLRELTMLPAKSKVHNGDFHKAVELSSVAARSYWQIEFHSLGEMEERRELLVGILRGEHSLRGGRFADGAPVTEWAVSEIVDLGDSSLLPELASYYLLPEASSTIQGEAAFSRHEDYVLAKVRIFALEASHESRFEALKGLLENPYKYLPDTNEHDLLDQTALGIWAVEQIYKLATDESLQFLIDYAVRLQKTYHDALSQLLTSFPVESRMAASSVYRKIIDTLLRKEDMSQEDLNERGLWPEKYFFSLHPY